MDFSLKIIKFRSISPIPLNFEGGKNYDEIGRKLIVFPPNHSILSYLNFLIKRINFSFPRI